ncbi:MAG: hypothetical protein LKE46_02835 [Clostridium sp.]|jgi:hypothetical protein|uniref:hypothetical protein n=1 Tax=Clostridium sp. TaxID=1506 RepID=UPI0025BB320C|nr:hypothetical protein [Clostridium sp.]MCH3963184.1 hypothetical protein [Clostridium sp.]MCI1716353.1 hypothetical protein [Clostridium sp.]MCI1800693.1 hypothetical protein [Clostridium sp.]MCI1814652.1 hypothetical protein [Clostridium sp.]MCI1871562.1 hypothetical protein [Clostridium sp.]
MNKFSQLLLKNINMFFIRKKAIDNMYQPIINKKIANIHALNTEINSLASKNRELMRNISYAQKRINEKERLIKNIQALTSNKSI